MKVLNLKKSNRFLQYGEVWKEVLLPVTVKKVICCFNKNEGLDLLSKAVFNFLGIKDKPNISEIATLLDFPRETIERVIKGLISDGFIDSSLNHIGSISIELEKKCGYIFYNKINGEQIPGILLMKDFDVPLEYSLDKNELPRLEDKKNNPKKNEYIQEDLNRWLRINSNNGLGDLRSTQIYPMDVDYLLPITIYYEEGVISWKIKDLYDNSSDNKGQDEVYTSCSYSIELQEHIESLIPKSPKLKNMIEQLSKVKCKKENKSNTINHVAQKYGRKLTSFSFCDDLIDLEKRISHESNFKFTDIKVMNSCYNYINKIVEFLIVTELKNKNIHIPKGNIIHYSNELIRSGFSFHLDSKLSIDTFHDWVKKLNDKRKISAHDGSSLISEKQILSDYESFLNYLEAFTGEDINRDCKSSEKNFNVYNARAAFFKGVIEWPYLPRDIITSYTIFKVDNSGINKAKLWESVLLWYIRKEGLTGGELVHNWRIIVKKQFDKSEKEIHNFFEKPPGIHFMKEAVEGNRATLGAYAYLVFLSSKPKGTEELESILGRCWWNELSRTVENRDNHYVGE